MNNVAIGVAAVASIAIGVSAVDAIYVVNEGRVAVITEAGRAIRQEVPSGFQIKTPFIVGVREFDVRERALSGRLNAATQNQLATTIDFSVNWRPDPARVLDIYVNYGSPEDFAINTIRPRLEQSLKAAVGQFSAAALTRERNAVAEAMLQTAQDALEGYPVIFSSVQIDNFTLPERYMEAVLQKEEQREATERESLRLEQQHIAAQQAVQTAEAERDATIARADGAAYAAVAAATAEADARRLIGAAEAEAIQMKAAALAENPDLIRLTQAESWNGELPATMIPGATIPMLDIR